MHHQGSKTGRQMEGPRAGKSPCSTFVQIRKTWSSLATPRVKDPAWSLQPGLLLWQAQKLLHAIGCSPKKQKQKTLFACIQVCKHLVSQGVHELGLSHPSQGPFCR